MNPTGKNYIYNLDYFMNEENFPAEMIAKWGEWVNTLENYRLTYFNTTVEYNLQVARLATEQAALYDLQGELTALENIQAVTIQAIAEGLKEQSDLNSVNASIKAKNNDIAKQKELLQEIQDDTNELQTELSNINSITSIEEHFDAAQLKLLDRYFFEDSLEDETFIAATSATYDNEDVSGKLSDASLEISGSKIESISTGGAKRMWGIKGGILSISSIEAEVIQANLEVNSDDSFVFTAYLNTGEINEVQFPSGCVSATGYCTTEENSSSSLSINITEGNLYFTLNTTEYARQAIEWELYEYGQSVLKEKSVPTYTFSVSGGNFLALSDFEYFKNNFTLGDRVYLRLHDNEAPITPYVTKINISYEERSDFEIEFSNSYSSGDRSFKLAALLEQSISMGKSLNVKSGVYSEFVNSGASTSVKSFMDSALDIAKNTVLSSGRQAIEFGDSGLRVRKWADEGRTAYSDEQIWIVDNMIAFTTDNWSTSNMAIGKIYDENILNSDGSKGGTVYGIAAPYLVGTILAGENLMIDTKNGAFKINESGVYIDSLKFYITHGGSSGGLDDPLPLSQVITEDGYLNARKLSGVIDSTKSQMQSAVGNVLFDYDGIWLMNNTSKLTSTKAIWMNEEGLLFGSGSGSADPANDWEDWTTAITHAGITADALAGKFLSGCEIYGGKLNINDNFIVDENGNLTAKSGTFKGVVQASAFKDSSGKSMMNNDYEFTADYLSLYGLEIKNKTTNKTTFSIDTNGNLVLGGGTISWANFNESDSSAYKLANTANSTANSASNNITKLANGTYSGGTFIDGTTVSSPTIRGGYVVGGKFFAVSNPNATISGGDIIGVQRMIIDSNGIISKNTSNQLDGISLTANNGFGNLQFYYRGELRGSFYQSGGNIRLKPEQRLLIGNDTPTSGVRDVWAIGAWNFTNATVTGLTAKFG